MIERIITPFGIFLSLIILVGATMYVSFWRGINQPIQQESEEVSFVIESGQGVPDISQQLVEQGLIRSAFYFDWYVTFKRIDKRLQAGEYVLNKNMNIREIAKKLSAGDVSDREWTVKIIEGWSIKEIAEYLQAEHNFDAGNFIKLTKPGASTCLSLESCHFSFTDALPDGANLEGYLFPDTYRIFNDATAEDVIAKMLNNFDKKVTEEMRADITKQGKTLHEIIIMASLLEKEVRTLEDMKIVSGIFWQRIEDHYPLQSCATLAYVLGEYKPIYSDEDTQVDSPYNTYKHIGLPPTPINNPGLNAITAAIYPEESDYYFFLNELETGKTHFSKTFEEHNKNKALYLK